jgi:hypothetical protein
LRFEADVILLFDRTKERAVPHIAPIPLFEMSRVLI